MLLDNYLSRVRLSSSCKSSSCFSPSVESIGTKELIKYISSLSSIQSVSQLVLRPCFY